MLFVADGEKIHYTDQQNEQIELLKRKSILRGEQLLQLGHGVQLCFSEGQIVHSNLHSNSMPDLVQKAADGGTHTMPFRKCALEGASTQNAELSNVGMSSVRTCEWEQQLPDGGWVPLNPDLAFEIDSLYKDGRIRCVHILRPRTGLEIDLDRLEIRNLWPARYCRVQSDGQKEFYTVEQNEKIATAHQCGTTKFWLEENVEIRFGANAVSSRAKIAPAGKISEVNVENGETFVVEKVQDGSVQVMPFRRHASDGTGRGSYWWVQSPAGARVAPELEEDDFMYDPINEILSPCSRAHKKSANHAIAACMGMAMSVGDELSLPDATAHYGEADANTGEWVDAEPPEHVASDMFADMQWRLDQKDARADWERNVGKSRKDAS